MMTIDLCLGSSAEHAQAETDWSLSGGIDSWHASSITPAVDAATEAMAEAGEATTRGEGATPQGAPEAATEDELLTPLLSCSCWSDWVYCNNVFSNLSVPCGDMSAGQLRDRFFACLAKGAPEAAAEAEAAEAGLGLPRFLPHRSRSPKGSCPKASSSSEVDMGAWPVRAPPCLEPIWLRRSRVR